MFTSLKQRGCKIKEKKTKGADASHHKSRRCLVLRSHGHRFSFQQLELGAISHDSRAKVKFDIIFNFCHSWGQYHVREPEYLKWRMIRAFANLWNFQFINSEHAGEDNTGERSFSTGVCLYQACWASTSHRRRDTDIQMEIKTEKGAKV